MPLLALLIACGGDGDSADSATGSGGAPEPTGATGSGEPVATSSPASGGGGRISEAEAKALAEAFASVKSFRSVITIEEAGQPNVEIRMDYAAPNRLYVRFPAALLGASGGEVEVIAIGSTQYMRPRGGQWALIDLIPILSFDADEITKGMGGFTKKGGTDTVNGRKCEIYISSTREVCVAGNLPLREVQKDALRGARVGQVTTIFTEYNSSVEIKAPF